MWQLKLPLCEASLKNLKKNCTQSLKSLWETCCLFQEKTPLLSVRGQHALNTVNSEVEFIPWKSKTKGWNERVPQIFILFLNGCNTIFVVFLFQVFEAHGIFYMFMYWCLRLFMFTLYSFMSNINGLLVILLLFSCKVGQEILRHTNLQKGHPGRHKGNEVLSLQNFSFKKPNLSFYMSGLEGKHWCEPAH